MQRERTLSSSFLSFHTGCEQEQKYLVDPKNVYVVYTVDTINIGLIKIIWLPMTYHVNQM